MTFSENGIVLNKSDHHQWQEWLGSKQTIGYSTDEIRAAIKNTDHPCYLIPDNQKVGASNQGYLGPSGDESGNLYHAIPFVPPLRMEDLGDPDFKNTYKLKYAYLAGSMANGISSEEMAIELGKAGFMGSFGSGGLLPSRIEEAILKIKKELPNGPFAFNLIHNPYEEALEKGAVDLYLKHNITVVEASAYLNLTPHVVYYRVAGLSRDENNKVKIKNRIIAKVSRLEVAKRFLEPAPERVLKKLISSGQITEEQAEMARQVPMADDITIESDSGGHTDNRPLITMFPSFVSLRDEIQSQYKFDIPVRIGAGGGIGTPYSAMAAFAMGAAYIVTGSINQACIESGSCDHVRNILKQVKMVDVIMAPSSDMFEMGVKIQAIRKGTLFPMRALKLYDIYQKYESINEIPEEDRKKLEEEIFRDTLENIWTECIKFFEKRDPAQIEKAKDNPKKKMALIFRWYVGLSSFWAKSGVVGREMDFQIWCGPSMGAFNDWVKGSYLEEAENRKVVDVAKHILKGAAYFYRLQGLRMQGVILSSEYSRYIPTL